MIRGKYLFNIKMNYDLHELCHDRRRENALFQQRRLFTTSAEIAMLATAQ
jgi:hypothetical protein